MKHKNGFNPLSRNASHLKAMHRNMVTSLFRYERVTTTQPKALEVRRTAEKLITRSKVDTVHNRRQVARFISDEAVLAKLFNDIGPRMKDRKGGYTRVLKLGFREGDAAEVAILELVDYKLEVQEKTDKKAAKAAKTAVTTEEKKPAVAKKAASAKKPVAEKKAESEEKPTVAKKTGAEKKPAAKTAATEKKPAAKTAKASASAEE